MTKTNLDILDQDSWNYVKHKKNKYGLRSVANYIFKLINLDITIDLDKWQFLIAIEKYYEYEHYDIDELSNDLELKPYNVRDLIKDYLGEDTSLYNLKRKEKEKIIRKIHRLMIENRILPRELSIAYYLRDYIDRNKIDISDYQNPIRESDFKNLHFNNRKIFRILFLNEEERRKEIYCETISIAEAFIKLEINEEYTNCEDKYILKDPEFIYYISGINIRKEDLEGDLISEILRQKFEDNYLVYYGLCLMIAIKNLIRRNLRMVKDFIEKELYIFKEPETILIFIDVLIEISGNEYVSNKEEKEIFEKYLNQIPTIQEVV